ncbi:MAG: MASE1 domain-containing protein [Parachlamydia sp.]|jgi:signal transduction histidine kinase|nr:MASE1 domain-containing protein [Parachlamydia sp.]
MKWPSINIFELLLIVISYVLAAEIGHLLSIPPGNVTPLWPPAGIALAFTLIYGSRIWPAILLSAFIGTLISFPVISGFTLFAVLLISLGVTAEALIGAYFMKRFAGTLNPINSIYSVFIFMVFATLAASLFGASIGTSSLWLFGLVPASQYGVTWLTWLLGDFSGCVSVASTLLVWITYRRQTLVKERLVELVILLSCVIVLSLFIFSQFNQLAFMLIPFIIWTVFRLGPHWSTVQCLIISLIATYFISKGDYIFGGKNINQSMLLFQSFLVILFTLDLALSALIESLYKANDILEEKVIERTADLHSALEELKHKEAQLLQSEKMSSLGMLTAGIAHEINNPINFVSSSIEPLQKDIEDVLTILDKYSHIEQGNAREELARIEEVREELDIESTLNEIPQLLAGIKDGAKRTAAIVKDLRVFSRLDEDHLKKVNIHEGLDAMLVLMDHRFKDKVELQTDFGDIPEIDCYPGKINQAFLSVFNNAIESIKENGIVTIKTFRKDENTIAISIKDTGKGMSPEIKKKIFDPFFTTKPIGAGTGLGLTITYTIIQEHSGSIEVKSEPDRGSEIIITLPIVQPTSGSIG